MSPKLKPLILPQLVEERRKLEERQSALTMVSTAITTTASATTTITSFDGDLSSVYYTTNSSSSDVTSPVTPTFSPRGHLRYSSSSSSLELPPVYTESPASPTQSCHKPTKRILPDVQEEPMEREDEATLTSENFGLYDCLGDEPYIHNGTQDVFSSPVDSDYDFDYDLGFFSDNDVESQRRKLSSADRPFVGFANRIGTRLPGLSRWKSTKRSVLTASPTTELTFENAFPSSRGPSSRSSSLSAPSRTAPFRADEPPLPTTPALSFWESSDSINMPTPIDIEKANDRCSIERDRTLATTPLLPPLLTETANQPPAPSPLQSPTVAPSSATTEIHSPVSMPVTHQPTHSLNTKLSIGSFRPTPTSLELPLPLPPILQDHDEWSDRLGHANFTITPQPYSPETWNMEALRKLRADWDTARVNYTKHLVRTGENYGQTSKIYAMTEEKWAETERVWRAKHDETMEKILAEVAFTASSSSTSRSRSRGRGRGRSGSGSAAVPGRPPTDAVFAGMQWSRLEDGQPAAVPRMLYSEGKFPGLGDEDIVGPMVRDAVMIRARSEERKGSSFWKHLAGKVGLRM